MDELIDPVKKFSAKTISLKLVWSGVNSEDGIEPFSALLPSAKTYRDVREPIDEGIDPVMLLLGRTNSVRLPR